jgi:hypothetical protein
MELEADLLIAQAVLALSKMRKTGSDGIESLQVRFVVALREPSGGPDLLGLNQCGFSAGGRLSGFGAVWRGAWRCSICFC